MSALDIAIRAAVADELARQLPAALAELRNAPPPADGQRLLSINDLRSRYGLGRSQIKAMIDAGRLPAVAVRMRGGRDGWRVRLADADHVLGGGAP